MSEITNCVKCQSENIYEYNGIITCPDCFHEFSADQTNEATLNEFIVKDSNGNELKDGDTVTVTKDLKVKGSSFIIKIGTKVKNIRLVDSDHNIDCKVPGLGQTGLKSEFVKKVFE